MLHYKSIVGKIIKRQGASKSTSGIDDISNALTKLAEKEALPIFIGTSHVVMQTPSFNANSVHVTSGAIFNGIKFARRFDPRIGRKA